MPSYRELIAEELRHMDLTEWLAPAAQDPEMMHVVIQALVKRMLPVGCNTSPMYEETASEIFDWAGDTWGEMLRNSLDMRVFGHGEVPPFLRRAAEDGTEWRGARLRMASEDVRERRRRFRLFGSAADGAGYQGRIEHFQQNQQNHQAYGEQAHGQQAHGQQGPEQQQPAMFAPSSPTNPSTQTSPFPPRTTASQSTTNATISTTTNAPTSNPRRKTPRTPHHRYTELEDRYIVALHEAHDNGHSPHTTRASLQQAAARVITAMQPGRPVTAQSVLSRHHRLMKAPGDDKAVTPPPRVNGVMLTGAHRAEIAAIVRGNQARGAGAGAGAQGPPGAPAQDAPAAANAQAAAQWAGGFLGGGTARVAAGGQQGGNQQQLQLAYQPQFHHHHHDDAIPAQQQGAPADNNGGDSDEEVEEEEEGQLGAKRQRRR